MGFWNTMPMRERSAFMSISGERRFSPSISTSPSARCPGYRLYMRFSTRSRVDLPQPLGPIIPVTCCAGRSRLIFLNAWLAP